MKMPEDKDRDEAINKCNMKKSQRYNTSHLLESQFEPDSRNGCSESN